MVEKYVLSRGNRKPLAMGSGYPLYLLLPHPNPDATQKDAASIPHANGQLATGF